MERLLELSDRSVYLVSPGPPAVYYIADHKAQGVLINAPPFSENLAHELLRIAPVRFLFLPSRFGVRDLAAWKSIGAQVLASEEEAIAIGDIDVVVGTHHKLTRTIDFVPLPGRTVGTYGLQLKNLPGALFLGPALAPGPSGWPELQAISDDYSYESRFMGIFRLRDLAFEYVFTDDFVSGVTQFGPGARAALETYLERLLLT